MGTRRLLQRVQDFPKARECLLPMGITSENVAERYGITREEQDMAAVESHKRTAAAIASGKLKDEIVLVATKVKTINKRNLNPFLLDLSLQPIVLHRLWTLRLKKTRQSSSMLMMVYVHGKMMKNPQKLDVKIGNRVEIGANTCIDRGSWRDTVIGDDTKIDNLVQIGHNVIIGKCFLLCGQVGIAGSA